MNVITSIILSVIFIGALAVGFDRNEVVECNTWKEQSSQFAGFYLSQWQADQCNHHNIIIDAPVR